MNKKEYNIDREVDSTGLFCPMPIIKTKKAITEMLSGQIIKLISTDCKTKYDIIYMLKSEVLELLEFSEENGIYKFILQKNKT